MNPPDDISVKFTQESLQVLNFALAFIMFGIALGIRAADFRLVYRAPKSVATGIASQFILLPFFTFLLVWVFQPPAAMALGLMLVAACPGGNVSNFISSLCGANIALSVTLTAVATLLCPVFTPLNFHFWAGMLPSTAELLRTFSISFGDMLQTVVILLLVPLLAGMVVRSKLPKVASAVEKPVRWISFSILLIFIGVALKNNFEVFRNQLSLVFVLVLIHNAMAFITGYFAGKAIKLPEPDCRSVCVETGIQNSGLGLIIIFTFFGGNGAMALVAAWWGVWHIIAGMAIAYLFSRKGAAGTVA